MNKYWTVSERQGEERMAPHTDCRRWGWEEENGRKSMHDPTAENVVLGGRYEKNN
jgi:hypothetical protein